MPENCHICGASSGQYHFGAISCRACAAFFRRYVNSKKAAILCKCNNTKSQYPCRLCRMKKCIEAGMQQSKVQGPRDANQAYRKRKIDNECSSPEENQIEFGMRMGSMDRICRAEKNYGQLEMTRKTIFSSKERKAPGEVNLYELSLDIKTDAKLLWKLCEMTFPEFDVLNRLDKKTLFFNFYTKWSILEMVMFSLKKKEPYRFFSPSGDVATPIERFYTDCMIQKDILSEDDVLRIFQPFWTYHIENVMTPFSKLRLGIVENMALFGILLWDAGYANISDSLAEMCRAMRTIMCRELNAYFEEQDGGAGSRLFEILDTLTLIERAERKCQEEIQLCGVYSMEVDEDMRNMIMWEKY